MGVVSRRVLPICGNLCFFCPGLRARSRQPVRRYKKLLSELFPKNQDVEPNDRKIGKLCEYASKNPLRIPKITGYLEQRFYKELRNARFGSVKTALYVYKKLLSSCKEQMLLFAKSLLEIIGTLLDQTQRVEMQILGCSTLVDFINNQIDSTCIFNLESLIPKLCQLAQEHGNDERALHLRSASLQVLASMVWLMGEHSHLPNDFDKIISVTLENYMDPLVDQENEDKDLMDQKVDSLPNPINSKIEPTVGAYKCPSYWSKVCLRNMAQLVKEVTTVRRVLEPLFHDFDVEKSWFSEKGLAHSVLTYMQMQLEEAGLSSHLLLSLLVKHLDHKDVVKEPAIQINICKIIIHLAQKAKPEASIAILGAITDLIKNLRKCIQSIAETKMTRDGLDECNNELQLALENCILELSKKVGDIGPILEMMAVVLENITSNAIVARTTVAAIYRTAQVISCIPNISYHKKAFPDALFHQLLGAMAHPDHETRIWAHHVFSIVLMPSLAQCSSINDEGSLSQTIKNRSLSIGENKDISTSAEGAIRIERNDQVLDGYNCSMKQHRRTISQSFKHCMINGKTRLASLRLSSHQVGVLLSSIWMQATSPENSSENFEALAHTFDVVLLFTRNKNSSNLALVRCFQLAMSLRDISLDKAGGLQPCRRRSLFTMASFMLMSAARAGNLSELIPVIKSSLKDEMVDPYLKFVDDVRLQAVSSSRIEGYGSQADEVAALKTLSVIESSDEQLKEIIKFHLVNKFAISSEDKISDMGKQVLEAFSPDDAYPLGAPLFLETPGRCSPLNSQQFDEVELPEALTDEEAFSEAIGSESGCKISLSDNSMDILSVNQLLESVRETANQVASSPLPSHPIPYDQMKNQCEALVTSKQLKISAIQSFGALEISKALVPFSSDQTENLSQSNMWLQKMGVVENGPELNNIGQVQEQGMIVANPVEHTFMLPPSSPYDKFLRAAGC
ncbi:protein SEMI-ROLLED LEAF 2 [Impatiens glandulifera]|uniref:protein SEMI-ROLLED LEAF 2 n=1 Tax=Impatiens glandulifera TaxID=253017 RepID=UPI001FB15B83|nr:protein SEMI-ROLLED LEAF 2 [Impatiens glandulifera]XP_047319150.1 protein SEMI-ROLLED LEAF 2 [Impatiens glandulifera]